MNTVNMKSNKYDYLYVLQGHYGYHGWEDLCASSIRKETSDNLKDYQLNEGGNYRIIFRRRMKEGVSNV